MGKVLFNSLGIMQNTVRGGVIKFDEEGFALGLFNGDKKIEEVPQEIAIALTEIEGYALKERGTGNVAAKPKVQPAKKKESGDDWIEDEPANSESPDVKTATTTAKKVIKVKKASSTNLDIDVD